MPKNQPTDHEFLLEDDAFIGWVEEHADELRANQPKVATVALLSNLPIVRNRIVKHLKPLHLLALTDLYLTIHSQIDSYLRDMKACVQTIDPATLQDWTPCKIWCTVDGSYSYRDVRRGIVRSNSADPGHELPGTHVIVATFTAPSGGE